jgi:hypothetical protein
MPPGADGLAKLAICADPGFDALDIFCLQSSGPATVHQGQRGNYFSAAGKSCVQWASSGIYLLKQKLSPHYAQLPATCRAL